MSKPKYRSVMDGKGGFIVEERASWFDVILFGRLYLPIGFDFETLDECDAFVTEYERIEKESRNFGRVIKEYK